ncbi:MAG: DNA polymerase IV [Mycoplasmatales bacterium]
MSYLGRQSKIVHIDMDYFYAQVEMRDNPKLAGKPVIISGPPNSRSVVCTSSYEARQFGVSAGISSYEASKKCPEGIFVPPHFEKYNYVSKEIHKIFRKYTDIIEPLSLDEAFLDVTINKKGIQSATRIAQMIQKEIFLTLKLTCSAGVSYNKFLSKIASDYRKPSGITVVPPEHALEFLETLEIKKFPGVGKRGIIKFYDYGIYTGRDFKKLSLEKAEKYFGKIGNTLYYRVRGIDNTHVIVNRIAKSIGYERTLRTDVNTYDETFQIFKRVIVHNETRLRAKKKWARTITIKIKYSDFTQITRSKTVDIPIREYDDVIKIVEVLLKEIKFDGRMIRLIGSSGSNLEDGVSKKRNTRQKIFVQIMLNLKY